MYTELNDRGFNLIEVLVAMVILSVGMLGTASLIAGIVRANQASRNVTTATTLAQDKMEEIVKSGYAGISSTNTSVPEDYGSMPGYANYRRVTTIAVDTPGVKMKTVTVQVSWKTGTNPVTLSTILSR